MLEYTAYSISYDLGVLLYHTTEYGHADFDLVGALTSFMQHLSFDYFAILRGFIAEAENYLEPDFCDSSGDIDKKKIEYYLEDYLNWYEDGTVSIK